MIFFFLYPNPRASTELQLLTLHRLCFNQSKHRCLFSHSWRTSQMFLTVFHPWWIPNNEPSFWSNWSCSARIWLDVNSSMSHAVHLLCYTFVQVYTHLLIPSLLSCVSLSYISIQIRRFNLWLEDTQASLFSSALLHFSTSKNIFWCQQKSFLFYFIESNITFSIAAINNHHQIFVIS